VSAVLADTHSIIWHLFDPGKLSAAADAAFNGAIRLGGVIYVSAISPIEVRYLVEKSKLPPAYLADLLAVIDNPVTAIRALTVDMAVARATEHVPRSVVPDLPDRIIAATALVHGLPLVTADSKLRASAVPTIW
jgi:PIN domain nuclease of toxin-antitoxin system